MPVTHYQLLEVLPTASPEVIAAAHKAILKQIHPDRDPDHANMAARVNEAYAVLSDPAQRARYNDRLQYTPRDIVGGKYRIIEKIATGGFGTTYKAEHIELPGGLVCIKHAGEITPIFEAILAKEAGAMWDLRHHAIPPVRDYLRLEDGSVALVMGYIPGPNLHELVERNGPISAEDVAWIAERILNALHYMHLHGVVHGDLKPLNVIVLPDTHEVSLVDFGLAAVRPTAAEGSIGFTELFGAPEAKKGLPLLPESDMYSLGATMVFALTNDLNAVKNLQVPATVPDELCDFIRDLMRRSPLDRPSWHKEDVQDRLVSVRSTAFGRRRSGFKPLEHIR